MPAEPTPDRPWKRGPMEPDARWSPPNMLHCLCGDPEGTERCRDFRPLSPGRRDAAIEYPGADAPNRLYREVKVRCGCSRVRWSWVMVDVRDLPEYVRVDHMGEREFVCDVCWRSWIRAGVLVTPEWRALHRAPEAVVRSGLRTMHKRGRRPRLPEEIRPELPSLPLSEIKRLRRPMFLHLRSQGRKEPSYADLPLPPGMGLEPPEPPFDGDGS